MTNTNIIISEAIANGIYTQDQVDAFLAAGKLPPIHTWAKWKQLGYKVRPGEHARITTKLWKMSAPKHTEDGEEEPHFYLAKASLFTSDQVERYLEVTA